MSRELMEVYIVVREKRKLHFGCLGSFLCISKMKFYLEIMKIEIRISTLKDGGIV